MPSTPCPRCGYNIDAATSLDGGDFHPAAGDLSVCIECGTWLVFDDELRPRELTKDERRELPAYAIALLDQAGAVIQQWRREDGR